MTEFYSLLNAYLIGGLVGIPVAAIILILAWKW